MVNRRRRRWPAGALAWGAVGLALSWAAPARAAEVVVVLQPQAATRAQTWAGGISKRLRAAAPSPGASSLKLESMAPEASPAYGRFWTLTGDVDAAQLDLLQADPDVAYAGFNRVIPVDPWVAIGTPTPSAERAPAQTGEVFPNDLLYPNQQAIKSVRAPQAWNTATGRGILIAIIDTGVDLDHADLAANIYINEVEAEGLPGVDDDGNGYVDDVRGYDFTDAPSFPGAGDYVGRDPDASDEDGHGTAVAGVAAAVWDNGVGIAGVAPEAKILPVRAGMSTTLPFLSALLQEDDAAASLIYAADQGAHIINCSWGDVVDSPVIRAAVQYAVDRGSLVVASAGNIRADQAHYPSGYPAVVSVGASDYQGNPTAFTTFGQDLDVMAPGYLVLGPVLNGGWVTFTGTSISAPVTSGVAALVWSAHPDWNAAQVAWQIMDTARRTGGWNSDTGWGLADAEAGVEEAPPDLFALELTGVRPGVSGGPVWDITGDVLGATLVSWRLWAQTVDGSRMRPLTPLRSDPVAGILGSWTPGVGDDPSAWVFRLEAHFEDAVRERRLRPFPSAELEVKAFETAYQVGREGWDLVVRWASDAPYQGGVMLTPQGSSIPVWREEAALDGDHALRFVSVPEAPLDLVLWGRAPGASRFTYLRDAAKLPPPPAPVVDLHSQDFSLPAGSLLGTQSDVDGDGNPEVIFEGELDGDESQYGLVRFVEVNADLTAPTGAEATLAYRGVPLDAAEMVGPGRLDLLVFRLDAWAVLRSDQAGGYPQEVVFGGDESSSPLGFVPELGGLLSVSGASLRLHDAQGNIVWSEDSRYGSLIRQASWGPMHEDGFMQVVVVDRFGRMELFRVSREEAEWRGSFGDVVGSQMVGLGNNLFVSDQAPSSLPSGGVEGLSRHITQYSLEHGSSQEAELVLAGRELQSMIPVEDGLWVKRDTRWDKFALDGHLTWVEGFEAGVDGGPADNVLAKADGVRIRSASRQGLWMGSLFTGASRVYVLEDSTTAVQGPELQVVSWERFPGGDSLRVTVEWNDSPCAVTGVQRQSGSDLREVFVEGKSFTDTLLNNEAVTYTGAATGACAPSRLSIQGSGSRAPVLSWTSPRHLTAQWDVNVPLEQQGRVRLHGDTGWTEPLAYSQGHDGALFIITAPEALAGVDSVEFQSLWSVYGLPLGGAIASSFAVPPAPQQASLLLEDVTYVAEGPELELTFQGAEQCPALTFLLTPGGQTLTGIAGDPVRVPLDDALTAGVYRLEYTGSCTGVHPAGVQARFTVGVLAYPNPVGTERLLWVSNLPPDTELELVDAAGHSVRSRMSGEGMPWDLQGLAAGLYLLRIQPPDRSLQWKKIALLD